MQLPSQQWLCQTAITEPVIKQFKLFVKGQSNKKNKAATSIALKIILWREKNRIKQPTVHTTQDKAATNDTVEKK